MQTRDESCVILRDARTTERVAGIRHNFCRVHIRTEKVQISNLFRLWILVTSL